MATDRDLMLDSVGRQGVGVDVWLQNTVNGAAFDAEGLTQGLQGKQDVIELR